MSARSKFLGSRVGRTRQFGQQPSTPKKKQPKEKKSDSPKMKVQSSLKSSEKPLFTRGKRGTKVRFGATTRSSFVSEEDLQRLPSVKELPDLDEPEERWIVIRSKVYSYEKPDPGTPVSCTLLKGDCIKQLEEAGQWIRHAKGWVLKHDRKGAVLELLEDDIEASSGKGKRMQKTISLGIRLLTHSNKDFTGLQDMRGQNEWRPLGILNRGKTCFFNTSMQALLSSQRFVDTILSINVDTLAKGRERVKESSKIRDWQRERKLLEIDFIESLRQQTMEYHEQATSENKREAFHFDPVLRIFRMLYPQFDGGCEHDAQEALASFLDVCGQIKTSTVGDGRISDLFRVTFKVERRLIKKRKKEKPRISTDTGYVLRVCTAVDVRGNLANITSVEQAMEHNTKWTKADSDCLLRDADGKKYPFEERRLLDSENMPEQLVIQLSRFRMVGRRVQKLKHKVQFPEILEMGPYTTNPKIPHSYRLHGVMVHRGHTATSGHYFTYLRNSENLDGGIWICNDDTVREAKGWDKAVSDAYVLFYVQED